MHEAFENDVARALDKGDRRMNSLADEITVVKLEQAESRRLLKENTDATNAIKADTAELLEAFGPIAAALDAFRQRQTDDVIAHDDPRQ